VYVLRTDTYYGLMVVDGGQILIIVYVLRVGGDVLLITYFSSLSHTTLYGVHNIRLTSYI